MLGMKNHFDISGSIEIRKVDIAGVACIWFENSFNDMLKKFIIWRRVWECNKAMN